MNRITRFLIFALLLTISSQTSQAVLPEHNVDKTVRLLHLELDDTLR